MLVRNEQGLINGGLSEQALTKLALNFLRRHYQNYLVEHDIVIEAESKNYNGITIDGSLSIHFAEEKNQESHFVTIEASNMEKRTEVVYVWLSLLFWLKALAFASVCTFFSFLLDHSIGFFINEVGLGITAKLSFVTLALGFYMFIYWLLFRKSLNFFFVYAIEQFKRYHADDQWIIISENLWQYLDFDDRDILKRQCIRYGVGLLKADENNHVHLLIDAAKYDTFKKKRSTNLQNYLAQGSRYFKRSPKTISPRNVKFNLGAFAWAGVSFMALLGLIMLETYQDLPDVTVNEAEYEEVLVSKKFGFEPGYFFVDQPLDRVHTGEIVYDENNIMDLPKNMFITSHHKIRLYDCNRINFEKGPYYAIQIDWFPTKEEILTTFVNYTNGNIILNGLWMGCNYQMADYYVLFAGPFFTQKAQALERIPTVKNVLNRNGITYKELKIVEISP